MSAQETPAPAPAPVPMKKSKPEKAKPAPKVERQSDLMRLAQRCLELAGTRMQAQQLQQRLGKLQAEILVREGSQAEAAERFLPKGMTLEKAVQENYGGLTSAIQELERQTIEAIRKQREAKTK